MEFLMYCSWHRSGRLGELMVSGAEERVDGSFLLVQPPRRLIMTVKIMTIMMRMSEIIPAMMYIRDSLSMKDLSGRVELTSFMLENLIVDGSFVVVMGSSTYTAIELDTSPLLPAASKATIE